MGTTKILFINNGTEVLSLDPHKVKGYQVITEFIEVAHLYETNGERYAGLPLKWESSIYMMRNG